MSGSEVTQHARNHTLTLPSSLYPSTPPIAGLRFISRFPQYAEIAIIIDLDKNPENGFWAFHTVFVERNRKWKVHRVSSSAYGHRTNVYIGSKNQELALVHVVQNCPCSSHMTPYNPLDRAPSESSIRTIKFPPTHVQEIYPTFLPEEGEVCVETSFQVWFCELGPELKVKFEGVLVSRCAQPIYQIGQHRVEGRPINGVPSISPEVRHK